MVVEFHPNSYIVNEREGMVRLILVKRTESTHDVTVHLSTVDGSAKAGGTHPTNTSSFFLLIHYFRV